MHRRWVSAVLASGVSALALGGLVLAAGADGPSHPRTYEGTTATGGTVRLQVSADGTRVTRFRATDVPDSCGKLFSGTARVAFPIVGGRFSSGPQAGLGFTGVLSARGRAKGTVAFRVVNVRDDGCEPKTVRWTAGKLSRRPLVSYLHDGGIAGRGPYIAVFTDRSATVTTRQCRTRFTLAPAAWDKLRAALTQVDLDAMAGDYLPPTPTPDGITYVIEADGSTVRIAVPPQPEHQEAMQRLEPLLEVLDGRVSVGMQRMRPSCR